MYYDVIMMISVSQYTSSNARFIGQSMFQKYLSQNGLPELLTARYLVRR